MFIGVRSFLYFAKKRKPILAIRFLGISGRQLRTTLWIREETSARHVIRHSNEKVAPVLAENRSVLF
ncbi:hypothetical protein LEP1GSC060_3842 [Leptospira weilii serovar Ranarum str. ICFT]|uniref:Uncharacterized protein n=1 Tax=Leptospira weilii serovar Ranarum str. ICFT TaxID=1218598 RepID=N1WI28_9LEPT|nr:hypothetical protein LEP1GSC060_3842 [Leptospira weilii serovar Ranarum str. ICFT]